MDTSASVQLSKVNYPQLRPQDGGKVVSSVPRRRGNWLARRFFRNCGRWGQNAKNNVYLCILYIGGIAFRKCGEGDTDVERFLRFALNDRGKRSE